MLPCTRNDHAANMIADTCDRIKRLLLTKNDDYGNSALAPIRIFSQADPVEQLRVRIDDKLSRIAGGGKKHFTEDALEDLIGYLILLHIATHTIPLTGQGNADTGDPRKPIISTKTT